jgi:hypothetical protein
MWTIMDDGSRGSTQNSHKVHFPRRGACVTAEVARGDGGHERGIDVVTVT